MKRRNKWNVKKRKIQVPVEFLLIVNDTHENTKYVDFNVGDVVRLVRKPWYSSNLFLVGKGDFFQYALKGDVKQC